MKEFKREDYVYLRLTEDFEDEKVKYKKGEILRYRKEWLIENITGRQFGNVFNYDNKLIYEKNDDCDENDFLYHKIYKSVIVSKDRSYKLRLWPGDYFYLNDWLFEHIDDSGIYVITNAQKKVIPDKTNSNKLIELTEGYPYKELDARIYFKKDEKLDFSNPAVIALFYNVDWMKLFAKTEVISDEEKQELFNDDFCNAIYAQEPSTAFIWKDDPNHDLHEYHYFKIKDDIRVKSKDELKKKTGIDIPYSIDFIYDDEGFIKFASTNTSCYDTSYRNIEQLILKFADRMSADEAYECHKNLIADYIKQREEQLENWRKAQEEEKIKIEKLYKLQKNNPSYFPGVNGHFTHNDQTNNNQEARYTINQIKEFYKKLKTLDPSVVKEMCFYGGTIPYILNNASQSRDFGDIDIFVPVQKMESLRKCLSEQADFEMICDSKPLAEFCHLTSRIPKKQIELASQNEQTDELFSLMLNTMMEPEDAINDDEDDNTHNPFIEFAKRTRPYYNKIQDFGFKAKLFGINISVFPIYQYENNIMAKSFNINDKNRFLLGVRVLNNENIENFVKNVEVYDCAFKILPLEYTLVSKKSAVNENYSFRLEKDKEDLEYILSHKEELGITDDKTQEILSKYPNYSISIAYKVNDNASTTTMSGETYKELVLTNRNIS